jgi:hypothetical protein
MLARLFSLILLGFLSNIILWDNDVDGNYSSLRRQLNFYGFRRDEYVQRLDYTSRVYYLYELQTSHILYLF